MRERPPGRPRDVAADEAILQAALEMFTERGIEGMSIEGVAKRAGVGKVTVYRRWSSKEDLVAQAIEHAVADVPNATDQSFAELPLAEAFARVVPPMADAMVRPEVRAMVAQVFGSSVRHPALLATYWEHFVVPRRVATAKLLERARDEGALAADADLEVLIDMLVGAVIFRALRPDPPTAKDMREYLESVYRQAGLL